MIRTLPNLMEMSPADAPATFWFLGMNVDGYTGAAHDLPTAASLLLVYVEAFVEGYAERAFEDPEFDHMPDPEWRVTVDQEIFKAAETRSSVQPFSGEFDIGDRRLFYGIGTYQDSVEAEKRLKEFRKQNDICA